MGDGRMTVPTIFICYTLFCKTGDRKGRLYKLVRQQIIIKDIFQNKFRKMLLIAHKGILVFQQ